MEKGSLGTLKPLTELLCGLNEAKSLKLLQTVSGIEQIGEKVLFLFKFPIITILMSHAGQQTSHSAEECRTQEFFL